jgi:hypothetical protein
LLPTRSRTIPACHIGAIRPTDGKLHLDRCADQRRKRQDLHYQYDKDLTLTSQPAAVPFNDTVFRAMVPAWVQLWKREKRNEFDGDLFKKSMGSAARASDAKQPRELVAAADAWPKVKPTRT